MGFQFREQVPLFESSVSQDSTEIAGINYLQQRKCNKENKNREFEKIPNEEAAGQED